MSFIDPFIALIIVLSAIMLEQVVQDWPSVYRDFRDRWIALCEGSAASDTDSEAS
jgi:hypothetical protein